MRTHPVFDRKGARAPIFQIENAYIGPAAIAELLARVEGVSEVNRRKTFGKSSDIHVTFQYLGRPYMVWEPFGDNSRYWIGPADMVSGTPEVAPLKHPEDIARLEDAFGCYRPPFHRAIIGNLVSLRLFKRDA